MDKIVARKHRVAIMLLLLGLTTGAQAHWTASVHLGEIQLEQVIEAPEAWWSDINDDAAGLGMGVQYEFLPGWSVRGLYQRSADFTVHNRCPDGQVCTAILITDRGRLETLSLTVAPEWALNKVWSLSANAGWMHWELDTRGALPGGSGSEFVFGLGVKRQLSGPLDISLEYERSELRHEVIRLGLHLTFGN